MFLKYSILGSVYSEDLIDSQFIKLCTCEGYQIFQKLSFQYKWAQLYIFSMTITTDLVFWKQYDNVKGATCSDEPSENYHPNLQFPSALWSFTTNLSSFFSCMAWNFTVLVHSHCSHNVIFGRRRQLFSVKKLLRPIVHYLLGTKQQT